MTETQVEVGRESRWKWLWPTLDSPSSAHRAIRRAFWAAVWLAGIALLLALLAANDVAFVLQLGFDSSAVFEASIFAAIACGLWFRSRLAAWAGLGIYCFEQTDVVISDGRIQNWVVLLVFVSIFANGVRGTSALHRMEKTSEPARDSPVKIILFIALCIFLTALITVLGGS